LKASSVAAREAVEAVCVSLIEGNAAAGDAEGLRKDMKEVRSFSAGVNDAGNPVVGP